MLCNTHLEGLPKSQFTSLESDWEENTDIKQKLEQLGFGSVLQMADNVNSSMGITQSEELHDPLAFFPLWLSTMFWKSSCLSLRLSGRRGNWNEHRVCLTFCLHGYHINLERKPRYMVKNQEIAGHSNDPSVMEILLIKQEWRIISNVYQRHC